MAWCWSTRASVPTMLSMPPRISSCLLGLITNITKQQRKLSLDISVYIYKLDCLFNILPRLTTMKTHLCGTRSSMDFPHKGIEIQKAFPCHDKSFISITNWNPNWKLIKFKYLSWFLNHTYFVLHLEEIIRVPFNYQFNFALHQDWNLLVLIDTFLEYLFFLTRNISYSFHIRSILIIVSLGHGMVSHKFMIEPYEFPATKITLQLFYLHHEHLWPFLLTWINYNLSMDK